MSAEHVVNPDRMPNRWLAGAIFGLAAAGWGYFVVLGVVQATNPETTPQAAPETTATQPGELQDMKIHKAGVMLIGAELGGAALGALCGGLYAHLENRRSTSHPSTS